MTTIVGGFKEDE